MSCLTQQLSCETELDLERTSIGGWNTILACIWWTIWIERNRRCFDDFADSLIKIITKCLVLFCSWCRLEHVNDVDSDLQMLEALKD